MSVQKSFGNSLRSENSPELPSCQPAAEEEEGGSTLSFKQGAGCTPHLKFSTQASRGQEDIYIFQTKKGLFQAENASPGKTNSLNTRFFLIRNLRGPLNSAPQGALPQLYPRSRAGTLWRSPTPPTVAGTGAEVLLPLAEGDALPVLALPHVHADRVIRGVPRGRALAAVPCRWGQQRQG